MESSLSPKLNHFQVGVGLRPSHYFHLQSTPPTQVEWFEIISENYMDSLGKPREFLLFIRRDFPVACHGVSLDVASPTGVDKLYLQKLAELIKVVDPFVVSDHLCWSKSEAHGSLHDLLPLPYTQEAIEIVVRNIDQVQNFLGRAIALENVSSYLQFRHSEMMEWEFINEIQHRSGCQLLLDVNNIYVNSFNHGFSAKEFIENINLSAVAQIHLAGHSDLGDYLFDTHSGPVIDPVWELFTQTVEQISQVPFLVEWDDQIPEFSVLEQEAAKAKKIVESFYEKPD